MIAYSLYGNKPSHTWGMLRNVQQAPVFFPGWTVRIYTLSPNISKVPVPLRLLNKMRTLGAEVYVIDTMQYPEELLFFHALGDKSVNTLLMRDPEFRLSDRQKSAVDEWLLSSSKSSMHCMRDHPSHADTPLTRGLLDINLAALRTHPVNKDDPSLRNRADELMDELAASSDPDKLEDILWSKYEAEFMCHDSVSCDKWPNSKAFPQPINQEQPAYEGQRYDENMAPKVTFDFQKSDYKCDRSLP